MREITQADFPAPPDDFDIKTHRECALCFQMVARVDYDLHMQGHGYTTLVVGPIVETKECEK
jgi:hypothetical protein